MLSKQELRINIRQLKAKYSPTRLHELSEVILAKLEQNLRFQSAQNILLYHSLADEVQTHNFIERWATAKHILLPKVVGDDLTLHPYLGKKSLSKGAFNILEPNTPQFSDYNRIDMAVIPGMAFDKHCHRLGRGKGYYDRLLSQMPQHIYKIGIAFPFQIITEVPATELDISVDEVIY